MKTYNLNFTALGKENSVLITTEVQSGTLSINYRDVVEREISEWLKKNELDGQKILILDIELNDGVKLLYRQADRKDIRSIEIFDV